jgi:hypothetical protein
MGRAGGSWSGPAVLDVMTLERVIRFETELKDDTPDLRVGDPCGNLCRDITGTTVVDSDVNQMILFEDARMWRLQRFLVIELSQWNLKFMIEDRGRLPITNNFMQELKIQRHCKDIGVHDNHCSVALPKGHSSYEVYTKLRLLETAPEKLAQSVMWSLFWELEIVPSYSAKNHWLLTYAPNFTKGLHNMISRERLRKIEKVMEA